MTRLFLAGAVALGVLAAMPLTATSRPWMVLPYRVRSMCPDTDHACTATGVRVVLPNADRAELQLTGPDPGVGYVRAGAPSNFVAR